jgi:hypothetical protein
MSVPYGQPPAVPQPGPPGSSDGGPSLGTLLALATGGLGLIVYFLSFTTNGGLYLRTGLVGFLLVGGALLAVASVLPKAPATLIPACVLVITGMLFLLVDVTNGPAFLAAAGGVLETPGLAIVSLVLAILESAACVGALLATAGVVKLPPRRSSFPSHPSSPWGPQQPVGYPGNHPAPGGYPGQQPVGPPAGGFPPQPQQPYLPQTHHYPMPGQYGGQPGVPQGQYAPPGPYGGEPGPYGGEPGPYGREPGSYGAEPGSYGGEWGEPEPQRGGEREEPEPQHGAERGEPGPQRGTPPGGGADR